MLQSSLGTIAAVSTKEKQYGYYSTTSTGHLQSHLTVERAPRTSSLIAGSVCIAETRSHRILRRYLEAVKYLLKNYAAARALTEFNAAILNYMQPPNMTPQKYADDVIPKSCKVADLYDECIPYDI